MQFNTRVTFTAAFLSVTPRQTWANNSTGDCYSSKTCQNANNSHMNWWQIDGLNSAQA